jgi:5-methylcytosine-specific restriction endonuclease McrA
VGSIVGLIVNVSKTLIGGLIMASKACKRHGNGNVANNGGNWIRKNRRKAIYLRDDLKCVYCGKGIEDGIVFTLDHLISQEYGGDHSSSNLVTCCKSCNSVKGKKTQRQFFAYLRDQGVDTDRIAKRIRRNIRRKLQLKSHKSRI